MRTGRQVNVEMIEHGDLQYGKFLGRGAEGEVHAAWYMETPVAVKQTSSVQEIEMNLAAGVGPLRTAWPVHDGCVLAWLGWKL